MKITSILLGLLAIPLSFVSNAELLQLEYSSFYSHLRKLNQEELGPLTFAFGFKQVTKKTLCNINSAYIHTDKQDIDITVDSRQRFVLPTEKALQLARAEVFIELRQPANQCDLSVQLEVKSEHIPDVITATDLTQYYAAFEAFFDEMGGFMSFLMPSPDGVTVYFNAEPNSSAQNAPWLPHWDSNSNALALSHEQFSLLDNAAIPKRTIGHITAKMEQ